MYRNHDRNAFNAHFRISTNNNNVEITAIKIKADIIAATKIIKAGIMPEVVVIIVIIITINSTRSKSGNPTFRFFNNGIQHTELRVKGIKEGDPVVCSKISAFI